MSVLKGNAQGRVQDQKPYIEVKDAILGRSGIYYYTYEEVIARGHKPAKIKDMYAEYRPPAVIAAAAPLFDLVPVPNAEHTKEDITSDNFHEHTSGIVGGPINIVPMPDGINIGLKGRIAFYTKEAYNYYSAGNKETSADYVSKSVLVDNPEEVGYDLIMTEIKSVNNVAITQRGRGGKDVRIQDSAPVGRVIDDLLSRRSTMSILTKCLGLGGQEQSFAATVRDSLTRFKKQSASEREEEIGKVIDKVASFTPSHDREALLGVVRDTYVHADAALAKWKDTEKLIDGLYGRCVDADNEYLASIQDKDGDDKGDKDDDKDDKKGEDEGKGDKDDKKVKDSAPDQVATVQDTIALIDKKFDGFRKEMTSAITESIKAALGSGADDPDGGSVGGVQDSVTASDIDFDSYVTDAFGRTGK